MIDILSLNFVRVPTNISFGFVPPVFAVRLWIRFPNCSNEALRKRCTFPRTEYGVYIGGKPLIQHTSFLDIHHLLNFLIRKPTLILQCLQIHFCNDMLILQTHRTILITYSEQQDSLHSKYSAISRVFSLPFNFFSSDDLPHSLGSLIHIAIGRAL